jgi:hypothetical protein
MSEKTLTVAQVREWCGLAAVHNDSWYRYGDGMTKTCNHKALKGDPCFITDCPIIAGLKREGE